MSTELRQIYNKFLIHFPCLSRAVVMHITCPTEITWFLH